MNIGFIGLGAMGGFMARNLAASGLLHAVWNRSADNAQMLAPELGCAVAEAPAELASRCEGIVICVSADADLCEVIEALQPALQAGALVIDCSTVSANTAREIAGRLAERQVEFLDCPVSGGVEGAKRGTLATRTSGRSTGAARRAPAAPMQGGQRHRPG